MLHFLVVDDSAVMRRRIAGALGSFGVGEEIDEAANGAEALRLMDAGDYDLVFLDLLMPELDGMRVLDHLRARPGAPPVIVASVEGRKDRIVQALQCGAADYIAKPFTPEALLRKAERVLNLSGKSLLAGQDAPRTARIADRERRRHDRRRIDARLWLRADEPVALPALRSGLYAQAVDISEGGIGFLSDRMLREGDLVRCSAHGGGVALNARLSLVRVIPFAGGFRCGALIEDRLAG